MTKQTKQELILLASPFGLFDKSDIEQRIFLAKAFSGRGVYVTEHADADQRSYGRLEGFDLDRFNYQTDNLPIIKPHNTYYQYPGVRIYSSAMRVGSKAVIKSLDGKFLPYKYILEDESEPFEFLKSLVDCSEISTNAKLREYVERAKLSLKKRNLKYWKKEYARTPKSELIKILAENRWNKQIEK